MELGETPASGDQVAFSFVFDATGLGRSQRAPRPGVGLTIRDGRLLRIQNYATWAEALEALESEPDGSRTSE
jgi:hypothetical protein